MSCASVNGQPKIQQKVITEQSVTAIETSQGNNTVYIHSGTDQQIFCADRGSDYAFTQSGGFSVSAKEGSTSAGMGDNTAAGVAELGGVNSGVLLTREVMYRTCEFMANLKAIGGLTPKVAQALFQKSLDAVLTISADYENSSETGQATESVIAPAATEN